MLKLYFKNHIAIISTLLLVVNLLYMLWGYLNRATIQKWQIVILLFLFLHGVFWYFANIRDLYSNSILYATDHSAEMGLFSVNSTPSIVFWVASIIIWLLGIFSMFKPQYRQHIFYILSIVSIIQSIWIESSRIWLYHISPNKFNYM